jgi:hypothetical protein
MPHLTPQQEKTGPGTCDRCGARVLWCLTDANRRAIAVDPAEDATGNQAVRIDSSGLYWARQLTKARPVAEQREVLRRPHIASCTRRPRPTSSRPGRRAAVRPGAWRWVG